MQKLYGIHHISLKVSPDQYKKTVAFYRDVLEFPCLRVQDNAVFLSAGTVVLEILNSGSGTPASGALDHFALLTGNMEAVLKNIRAAGLDVTMEPTVYTFPGKPPYSVRIAFFCGPSGESVELFSEESNSL